MIKKVISCILISSIGLSLHAQTVTTLAGSQPYMGSYADGSAGTARFNNPTGVCIYNNNIYVADKNNNCIRKIDPTAGTVMTFAGSTVSGSSDGNGTSARFNRPSAICVDNQGNFYVTDEANNKIRKITAAGDVTTLAGSGQNGKANGFGAAASFNWPRGICISASGIIYVADSYNHLIRRLDKSGNVTTVAGSGIAGSADGIGTAASFSGPEGICVDQYGNLYIADTQNKKIRKVEYSTNKVTSVYGSGVRGSADGNGTSAQFQYPVSLAINNFQKLYVSDMEAMRIREINMQTNDVTTLNLATTFTEPYGIVADAGYNLYLTDANGNSIRKITLNGAAPATTSNIPFACSALDCNVTYSGRLKYGTSNPAVNFTVPYKSGNGGKLNPITITPMGNCGQSLTAYTPGGVMTNPNGSIQFNISGIPSFNGDAVFVVTIDNKKCFVGVPIDP